MSDDGVREIHGGTMAAGCQEKPYLVFERDDEVLLLFGVWDFKLAPHNARWLARKLNRVSLRIEKRLAAKPGSAITPVAPQEKIG